MRNTTSGLLILGAGGWGATRVDRNRIRALLSVYRHDIMRYQKLLKTHLTEFEQDYLKERLVSCNAAVEALSGRGSPFAAAEHGSIAAWVAANAAGRDLQGGGEVEH